MNAQERLDTELEGRQLDRLKPATVAQVRRLCRHPETALEIFYDRLLLGCVALDEQETEDRWQLWELLLCAYRVCQDALDEERCRTEAAEIQALNHDPERRAMRGRLRALNYRSGQEHLKHEQSGLQVPLPEPQTDTRQPQLIRRQRKGTQNG